MLRALNDKVVLKKHEAKQAEQKGIYLPLAKEAYYEVVDASSVQGLLRGDLVVVRKENLYSVYHEGHEYFIISYDDVLAKCDK